MGKRLNPDRIRSVGYRFLEDIATADIAFEAEGKTLEELFSSAATALEETQVSTEEVGPKVERNLTLENDTIDKLLFDFLNELIYFKDAQRLVFSKFKIRISPEPKPKLTAKLWGEELNPDKHEWRTDVKAVTKHLFGIEKTTEGYKAVVVLDV